MKMPVTDAQIEAAARAIAAGHYGFRLSLPEDDPQVGACVDAHWPGYAPDARRALEAASSAQAPDGWQLVPIEPTNKMLMRCQMKQAGAGFRPNDAEWLRDCWSAMLEALPQPPAGKQ